MDPNATLQEIRELEARMRLGRNHRDVDKFRELVEELDEWLSKGGFLPSDWQR